MDDYFLTKLIRQRHEEILAEVRAARLSKQGRSRVIPGNKLLRRLRSFFSKHKSSVVLEPQSKVERKPS